MLKKKTVEQITRTYPGHTTTTLDGSRSTSSTASYLSVVRRVADGYMIGPLIILALPRHATQRSLNQIPPPTLTLILILILILILLSKPNKP